MSDLDHGWSDERVRNPIKDPIQRVEDVGEAGFTHEGTVVEIGGKHQGRVVEAILRLRSEDRRVVLIRASSWCYGKKRIQYMLGRERDRPQNYSPCPSSEVFGLNRRRQRHTVS